MLLERLDNRYLWETSLFGMPRLKRLPSAYFRDHFVVTTSGMNYTAPLQLAVTSLGVDKVLFAADWPMEVMDDAVRGLERAPISRAQKRAIFDTNVRRVFRI